MRIRLSLTLAALTVLGGCRKKEPPLPPPPRAAELRLVAVGDIMMHQDVKKAAKDGGFDGLWSEVSPLLKDADIAFGNLETPVAPQTGRPGVPFVFNAPAELPAALRSAGWTVVSTANNHAWDQGSKGLRETIQHLDAAGLLHAGTGATKAEAAKPIVLERGGLRLGLLAFTDVFNADLDDDEDAPWVQALDLDEATSALRALRPTVDALIVSVHWGNEYQRTPSPRQKAAAQALVAAGADLILGHHPHVLQPMAWVEAEGRRGFVAYSLGNFISNQDRMWRVGQPAAEGDSRDGALLQVRFVKPPGGALRMEPGYEPLWVENRWGQPGPRVIRVRRLQQPENEALAKAFEVRKARIAQVVGRP
jgi:poly-gamma-glutamate synthesis protein (capsule biosynthesis protein)